MQCLICFESFTTLNEGISCAVNHFICTTDICKYVSENALSQVYKLRQDKCQIKCPCSECSKKLDNICLFDKLSANEKKRYTSLLEDFQSDIPTVPQFKAAIYDLLTLKCPSCFTSVDPIPDACSAVMCLNCGNFYCNYCFVSCPDRGAAHSHAATHNTIGVAENRDAFLPAEVVKEGQKILRKSKMERFVKLSYKSLEFGMDGGQGISLALILCWQALVDLDISPVELWRATLEEYEMSPNVVAGTLLEFERRPDLSRQTTTSTLSNCNQETTETDDDVDFSNNLSTTVTERHLVSNIQHHASQLHKTSLQGAKQLNNALVSHNRQAVQQILASFKDEIDVTYVDQSHGVPLVSLAILSNEPEVAIRLLDLGANPFAINHDGRNAIYVAVELAHISVLEKIIEKNAVDLNAPVTTEFQQYKALHVAARYNHGGVIRFLLKHNVDVDTVEYEHGYTPLALALVLGHEWSARELLMAGANVELSATNGRTPMFVAAEKGLSEFIQLAISRGRFNVNSPVIFPFRLRALHVAACHKQAHIVSLLLSAGADVNAIDDENGFTPLDMAIIGGCVPAALEIIASGININKASRGGRKAMFLACEKGLADVMLALMRAGVSINAPATEEITAYPPLHVAVIHFQNQLVSMLLSLGANINATAGEGRWTPLVEATILGNEWCVRKLVACGADPSIPSREGRLVYYFACEKGHAGILRHLLQSYSFNVNFPVTYELPRFNCLHIAASYNHAHIVAQLLDFGADVNVKDAAGRTALQIAEFSNAEASKLVLQMHNK